MEREPMGKSDMEDLQTDTRKNNGREMEPKPTRLSAFWSLWSRTISRRTIEDLQTDTRKNNEIEDLQTDTRKNNEFGSLWSGSRRIREDVQTDTRKNDGIEDLQTDTRKNDGVEMELKPIRISAVNTFLHIVNIISDASRNKKSANSKNLTVANQTTYVSSSRSRNGAKLMKSALVLSQYLACASGTDLEDNQHDQQVVFGIYPHTLGSVLHCPNISDYTRRASDKCAEVCGSYIQDGNCAYHCMRDSSQTSLVEFCAKPRLLFDYCPVYDLLGRSIQIDISTLCNPSNHFQRYYNSSDIFFCDPGKCLQLPEAVVNTGVTHLMTETTPINNGSIIQTWLSQYWYVILLLGLAVFSCFVFVCIFRMYKNASAWSQKLRREEILLI